jgi:SAM-dependent methyltransferase
MLKKIGKNSNGILKYQEYLIDRIDDHIFEERKFENQYISASRRIECIICNSPFSSSDFQRNGIEFSFCNCCGHLNGHNELTEALMNETYDSNVSKSIGYDKVYIQHLEVFHQAVKNIYIPKANFLSEALTEILPNENLKNLKILDFGTGSGHMVAALNQIGFDNVLGIDPMASTIEYGTKVIGISGLKNVPIHESMSYLKNTDANLVTMICTLPHVANHNEIIEAMVENKNILYTFQKVPMFSLGAILDVLHPRINSRVLSGAHTHLYTDKSLDYLENKYNLERSAEWRFGADSLDLFRHVEVKARKKFFSQNFLDKFGEKFLPVIDEIQLIIDNNNFSSEIHFLWKFKR